MSPAFIAAFNRTMGLEGGYSDRAADRGGATNHGITERVARAHGYTGDMRDLPLDLAQSIAKAEYWDTIRGDDIAALSPLLAQEMFDTHYNGGAPGQWLQRCLNVLNEGGRDYPDLPVTGNIGPLTLSALRSFLTKRGKQGELVLLRGFDGLRVTYFIDIAERDATQEANEYGWLSNRIILGVSAC